MEGKSLVNVKKCFIINERTNEKFDIADTAEEIGVEPILSEGKRDILRVKNRILAINETEDIVIGYKLKLKDNTFNMDVIALVDGGTITTNGYKSIGAGQVVEKDLFTLEIYTEEKDYSRTIGYTKFLFKHCKGKAPKYSIKDGEFIVPEFEAESIPFRGEYAVEIDNVNTIPVEPVTPPSGDMAVVGGTVTDSNSDVAVSITSSIKWTFTNAINQDDVTKTNFVVTKKSDGSVIDGNVTIDTTKKIVTFVPTSIEKGVTYVAEAKAVNLLDGTGTTTPISVEFTTI
ncbi:Ig-like domain-containing protein [Clostridium sp. JNZ J1-5]